MVTSRRPAWSAFGGPTGRERPGPLGCDEFLYGFEPLPALQARLAAGVL